MKKATISTKAATPEWAVLEREIIAKLNKAAPEFVKKYTNVDGTLKWKSEFGSMDGSDDPYEAFHNLALLYAIGGSEEIYELARKMWESITSAVDRIRSDLSGVRWLLRLDAPWRRIFVFLFPWLN